VANSPQAKKRVKQANRAAELNKSARTRLRTFIKKVVYALRAKKFDDAKSAYQQAVPVIDRMVNKGIIHHNKAARLKSRLNRHIKNETAA